MYILHTYVYTSCIPYVFHVFGIPISYVPHTCTYVYLWTCTTFMYVMCNWTQFTHHRKCVGCFRKKTTLALTPSNTPDNTIYFSIIFRKHPTHFPHSTAPTSPTTTFRHSPCNAVGSIAPPPAVAPCHLATHQTTATQQHGLQWPP